MKPLNITVNQRVYTVTTEAELLLALKTIELARAA